MARRDKTTDETQTVGAEDVGNMPAALTENKGTAVAVKDSAKTGMVVGGVKFKLARQVTYPLLKHEEGQTVLIRPDAAFYTGKKIVNKRDGSQDEKEPELVVVTNAEDMRQYLYIVNAVLRDTWSSEYKDNSYVGRWFAIEKMEAPKGKRYKTLNILEVETDGEVAA